MDGALISALAAVWGSLVGSMAPVMANYVVQRGQTRREILSHDIAQRELQYSDFIKDAARLYAKSMSTNLETLDELVALYALVSRMRLMSSDSVLAAAEKVVDTIGRQYGQPNLTLAEIEIEVHAGKVNPLGAFSAACRHELKFITDGHSSLLKRRSKVLA